MKQIPLQKMTPETRNDYEKTLVENIGKAELRDIEEKIRRKDWNKAQAKIEQDISKIARKLREDDVAPTPDESAEDRQAAEETAERMVVDEETDSDPDK